MTKEQCKDKIYKKDLVGFEEALDKYISGGGDINEGYKNGEDLLYSTIYCENIDAAKFLIKKGAKVGKAFERALYYERYNILPILLEAAKITIEEKQWIEKICQQKNLKGEQLENILSALERAEIVESELVRVPMKVGMDIELNSEARAKSALCATLYSLSDSISQGKTADFAFAPILSKEEQQTIEKMTVKEYTHSYGNTKDNNIDDLQRGLGDKKDAEFVMNIIDRTRNSIAECVNADISDISYSFTLMENSGSLPHWHRDGGSPEDIRITLAIKGDGTMFARGLENTGEGYGIHMEDVKEFSQPSRGEIAAFNLGKEMTFHSAPLSSDSRILAVFSCDSCVKSITEQALLQKIGESIAPEIRLFNETRNVSMEAVRDVSPVSANTSIKSIVAAFPMEMQQEIAASGLLLTQGSNTSYQLSTNVQDLAVQSSLSLALLELGKNIRQAFTTPTPNKHKAFENKLSSLKENFKERGYEKLAEDTANIMESIERFNKQSPDHNRDELKKQAKEIISKYNKLERVAKFMIEKDLSKKTRSR